MISNLLLLYEWIWASAYFLAVRPNTIERLSSSWMWKWAKPLADITKHQHQQFSSTRLTTKSLCLFAFSALTLKVSQGIRGRRGSSWHFASDEVLIIVDINLTNHCPSIMRQTNSFFYIGSSLASNIPFCSNGFRRWTLQQWILVTSIWGWRKGWRKGCTCCSWPPTIRKTVIAPKMKMTDTVTETETTDADEAIHAGTNNRTNEKDCSDGGWISLSRFLYHVAHCLSDSQSHPLRSW